MGAAPLEPEGVWFQVGLEMKLDPAASLSFYFFSSPAFYFFGGPFCGFGGVDWTPASWGLLRHPAGFLDPAPITALSFLRQGQALPLFQGAFGAHSINSANSPFPPWKLQQVSGSHF